MVGERGMGGQERQGKGLVEEAIECMNRVDSGPSPDLSEEEPMPRVKRTPRAAPRAVKNTPRSVAFQVDEDELPPLRAMPGDGGRRPPPDDIAGEDDFADDVYGAGGGMGGMNDRPAGRFGAAGSWMQWGVMALIAIVICYAMIAWMGTSKGEIASMADERIVNAITPMKAVENTLRTDLDNLEAMALTPAKLADYAKKSDLTGYITAASLNGYATVEALGSYVKTSDVSGFLTADVLSGYVTKAGLAGMLEGTEPYKELEDAVDATEDDVALLEGGIAAMDARVDVLEARGTGSAGMQYSLTGSSVDFRLKVKSPEAGWYVGYVTLVYRTPIALNAANNTYDGALVDFYGKLSDVGTRVYIPKMIAGTIWDVVHNKWQVTGWKLGEVTFFTGRFQLAANVEKELALHIGGLNAFPGYEAYIDILESSVSSSETGGGSI